MRLSTEELAYVRRQGFYVTEKCDECGKLLNQSVRYTTPAKPKLWCSAACQDEAMGWDKAATRKTAGSLFYMRVCQNCTKRFRAKHEDARFCSQRCQKRARRNQQNGVVRETVQPPLAEAHGQRARKGSKTSYPPCT